MASIMNTRPMTLKQAKQAFHKSAGPKLTEKELRLMTRNAELFKREQKCKEKEKAKRENKRKRQEKEKKLREQRRKMGVPEQEETYVSPRQVRLRVYFGTGKETDRNENISNTNAVQDESRRKDSCGFTHVKAISQERVRTEINNLPDEEGEDQVQDVNPRLVFTENRNRMQKPSLTMAAVDDKDRHTNNPCNKADRTTSQRSIMSDAENKDLGKDVYSYLECIPEEARHSGYTRKGCTGWRMPLQEMTACNVIQTSCVTTELPKQVRATTSIEENDWMSLLPSNTQVERELSDHFAPQILPEWQAQRLQPRQPCVKAMLAIATPNVVSLVASEPSDDIVTTMPVISTQDLEFTEEEIADLTTPKAIPNHKISVQERAPSPEFPEAEKNALPSSDFGEFGLSTQDLQDLLSPISMKSAGPEELPAKPTKEEMEPFDFGDFPVTTQEFLELVE